ncbi:hypothetical protein INS49_006611 [Diaporthe citri]|uniref:uncharacterized protein n=1 Tax=Diaporthe citri TaxID=83186 RepID=UPI001C819DC5|nr:uncharacterized protein INS49_006611 [Diaporthe citri]KAG6365005.1 hypothetical protein INS49_006611 [Diaporthe citri]
MLCEICVWMLRGRRGQIFGGTLGLHFVHHDSAESFWTSVSRDCSICRVLGDELGASFFPALQGTYLTRDRAFLDLRSQAHLDVVKSLSDEAKGVYVYRLDFTVEWAGIKFSRTFVLRPTGFQELQPRTPISDHMYHAEVLGLAKTWLKKCKCVEHQSLRQEQYPTRLINLAELKKLGTIDLDEWKYHGAPGLSELQNTNVNLVETKDLDEWKLKGKNYVTLSHKWGGTDKPVRLTKETQETYQRGVKLGSLPKTFQDAIRFALRVDDSIHYIWIDSLCIIQGDPDDWLKESALMQRVYRNSFLNISATAAENSGEGLYSERYPQHLWEDVVSLDVDGLHKGTPLPLRAQSGFPPKSAATDSASLDVEFTHLAKVRSCLLLDVSNWEKLVNQAPVNKRGWVVQERLLAPRVLHFCRGRIAWECAEFDEIEGHYPNIPNYQLVGDEIYEGIPIKGLEPEEHGQKLRKNRLRGGPDPLLGDRDNLKVSPIVHSLELWARIVEMYSRTDLTQKKDKLIALSGIAHSMAAIIETSRKAKYVAGLWDAGEHLVSQLLWHVEPVCRGDTESGTSTLEYPSKRPKEYRAPSFSWASIDAQYGNGITCGDVVNPEGILVKVPQDDAITDSEMNTHVWGKSVFVQCKTENEFGLVTGGHIRLEAYLYPAKLQREGTHYHWSLGAGNGASDEVSKEKHYNVCLDCPGDDDQQSRLTKSDEIHCMPVALKLSTKSTDLVCLLLERVPENVQTKTWPENCRERSFRRIGFSKLSLTFDHLTLRHIAEDIGQPSASGNEEKGKQIVYII